MSFSAYTEEKRRAGRDTWVAFQLNASCKSALLHINAFLKASRPLPVHFSCCSKCSAAIVVALTRQSLFTGDNISTEYELTATLLVLHVNLIFQASSFIAPSLLAFLSRPASIPRSGLVWGRWRRELRLPGFNVSLFSASGLNAWLASGRSAPPVRYLLLLVLSCSWLRG